MKFFSVFCAAIVAAISTAFATDKQDVLRQLKAKNQQLAAEQVYTHRFVDEAGSLDPGLTEDGYSFNLIDQMFEGLLQEDSNGNMIPGVAVKTEVSLNKKTYIFHLRKDAKWSDGRPVTAYDFEYAWKRVVNPENGAPYAFYLEQMAIKNASEIIAGQKHPQELGIIALDDFTLQVDLSKPLPFFKQMLSHGSTFPVPRWAIEAYGEKWTRPENIVSNGAYVLKKHTLHEAYRLERNKHYWDDANTFIDHFNVLVIVDNNQGLNRFLAGEVDYSWMPYGQYPRLKKEYPEDAHATPILCTYYYALNVSEHGPDYLKNPSVRQALALTLDKDIIINKIALGGQLPAYTLTPTATAGFITPDNIYADLSQKERDDKARQLLESAGYGPGNPLHVNIIYNTNEGHKKVALGVSQMWKQKLAVQTNVQNLEWKTLISAMNSKDFEIARYAQCADYNEASSFLSAFISGKNSNKSGFANADFDQIMQDAQNADNPAVFYERAEQILASEMPLIPIYHYTAPIMLNRQIKGYPFNNAADTWYVKNLYKITN